LKLTYNSREEGLAWEVALSESKKIGNDYTRRGISGCTGYNERRFTCMTQVEAQLLKELELLNSPDLEPLHWSRPWYSYALADSKDSNGLNSQ
jgi:hypothetical protein